MSEPLTTSQAAAEAAKWGQLIRSLQHVQGVIDAAVALEQNRSERQRAVDLLGTAIEELNAQKATTEAALEDARAKRVATLAEATKQANEIVAAAKTEAAKIIAEARVAQSEAEQAANAAKAEANAAYKRLDEARVQTADAEARLQAAIAAGRERFGA